MDATGPHARLLAAAREAMGKLQADYSNVSTDKWHDNDAMQIFENLFNATEDIEKQKVDADAAPELLAALNGLIRLCDENGFGKIGKDSADGPLLAAARAALAKAEGK